MSNTIYMAAIELTCISHRTASGLAYQHLHIHLAAEDGLIEPEDLKGLVVPDTIVWSQGVVIEGKAPIWLYGYLVHACHPAAWVACYDPRLGDGGGAVVVATHARQVKVGEVLLTTLPL
ncbi:CRISPR-associated ring nuclease Crn3/Csx3 [Leptolyngbya sp. 'hensonii']|uniref:CRISPR-associated ring nuclease Crn3/Csx3 n=1 Tax=Leptolyngbya sp. 'hensonii' TaxID=1922337 RepID=UPI000B18EFF7|nr:CRISPR-associated ring nuclease Crn3/Csx3 [Leptolyngbya sp. 'hensonii']